MTPPKTSPSEPLTPSELARRFGDRATLETADRFAKSGHPLIAGVMYRLLDDNHRLTQGIGDLAHLLEIKAGVDEAIAQDMDKLEGELPSRRAAYSRGGARARQEAAKALREVLGE